MRLLSIGFSLNGNENQENSGAVKNASLSVLHTDFPQ